MSDIEHVEKTLTLVLGHVQALESQLADKKKTANELSRLMQRPPMFPDVDTSHSGFTVRSDEYYGKPIADVIRSILEKRKAANLGAASVTEIFEAMQEGSYQFKTQNRDYAKRGVYSVLAGDTFHRLPNGRYGLAEWYPTARPAPEQNEAKQKPGRKIKGARAKLKSRGIAPQGGNGTGKTRLEQISELLRSNGPMTRKEIRDTSGLPKGTVASLLNGENFKHETDGRWSLKGDNA